jgi:hypothetical protein
LSRCDLVSSLRSVPTASVGSLFGTTAVVVIDLVALFPKEPAYPAGIAKSGFAPFSTVMGKGVFLHLCRDAVRSTGLLRAGGSDRTGY